MRFLVTALLLTACLPTWADELDREPTNQQVMLAKDLPATLVVRVSESTGATEVLHSAAPLAADAAAVAAIANSSEFVKAKQGEIVQHELDRDSSSSSWYFCYNGYYGYQSYYYYGYNYYYSNYYSYRYAGYNYYYYRWGYWY